MDVDFTYKPALLAKPRQYTATDTSLICRDNNGQVIWQTRWDQIAKAAYVDHKIKVYRLRRLDLICGQTGALHSIAYTCSLTLSDSDPDSTAFLGLLSQSVKQLSNTDPEFKITVGEYGRARLVFFVIGVISLLAAFGITGLAIGTGVASGRLMEAAVPFGIMFLLGGSLVWSYAPWRPLLTVPATVMALAFDAMLEQPEG